MAHALYVCRQDDDKIARFAMDADSGGLVMRAELAAAGGPSVMAISPDRTTFYDGEGGALTRLATLAVGQRRAAVLATRLGD
jgi:hypothetical protein